MSFDIKHIFLPLIAGMAFLAACSTTSEPDPEQRLAQSEEEMRFEIAGGSRTIETTDANITEQPFMLFGDVKFSETFGAGLKQIFYWHNVEYNGLKNLWDYGTSTQYWFMGLEHSFVAIHPFIDKKDPQVSILEYKNSELSFTYHLPDKLEEAKDLLFATHRRKYTLDNKGPVQLQFTHLLPRINISMALIEKELMYDHVDEQIDPKNGNIVGNRNEYIAVHSVEFQNVKTRASFTFTAVPLGTKTSTYDYVKDYLVRDDDLTETIVVTLQKTLKVPNSYHINADGEEDYELEYVTALDGEEIVVMLPQTFAELNEDSKIVINYSINDDKDLKRRIVIPLAGTTWKEGTVYTYKFLINNPYFNHITDPAEITVEIDDYRLVGAHDKFDDAWLTDDEDPSHNINYGYDDNGNCGPVNKPAQK